MKVEVGSGGNRRDGYTTCDARPLPGVDHVCFAWELPFDRLSLDEIYSRHMLEHLTLAEAVKTVTHWYSLLKTNGVVDITVPNGEEHIKQLLQDGNSSVFPSITNVAHAMAGLYGWQRNEFDVHKWLYTFDTLCNMLVNAGFVNIVRARTSHKYNLRVIAKRMV